MYERGAVLKIKTVGFRKEQPSYLISGALPKRGRTKHHELFKNTLLYDCDQF